MEDDRKKSKQEVNEPASAYFKGMKVTVSRSFEEASEQQYRYWLSLDVESRLALHYKLLVQIHGEPDALDIKTVHVYP